MNRFALAAVMVLSAPAPIGWWPAQTELRVVGPDEARGVRAAQTNCVTSAACAPGTSCVTRCATSQYPSCTQTITRNFQVAYSNMGVSPAQTPCMDEPRWTGEAGMMRHWLSIFATLSALVPGSAASGEEPESAVPSQQYWQVGSACGPNALYVLLRIHDRPVDYIELLKHLNPPRSGSSFEELRSAARWGLKTSVYQANRKSIGEIDMPFIAHLRFHDAEHYVVVGRDEEDVQIRDEDRGGVQDMRNDKFFKAWTGYVLASGTGRE